MASKQMIIVFTLVVVAFAPSIALAKEFIVGDGTGWTIGFNYQAWAQGKEFHVGDKLVFQYPVGAHNVHKVMNGTDFQACTVPLEAEPLKTGNDIITLATPGRKWYICGVGKHCESGGQKLFITVLAESAAAPAPSPMQSSANVVASSGFQNGFHGLIYNTSILFMYIFYII